MFVVSQIWSLEVVTLMVSCSHFLDSHAIIGKTAVHRLMPYSIEFTKRYIVVVLFVNLLCAS